MDANIGGHTRVRMSRSYYSMKIASLRLDIKVGGIFQHYRSSILIYPPCANFYLKLLNIGSRLASTAGVWMWLPTSTTIHSGRNFVGVLGRSIPKRTSWRKSG